MCGPSEIRRHASCPRLAFTAAPPPGSVDLLVQAAQADKGGPGSAGERKRKFVGQNFWASRYFVSTVVRDEAVIREYVNDEEKGDEQDRTHPVRGDEQPQTGDP